MSWDDLKKLKDEPLVTIGGHTKHHYNLKQLADEEKVSDEVKDGCNLLKEKTGIDVQVFAYPFGSPSEAGEREFKVLSKFGFKNSVIAYGGACNINNCENNDKHSNASAFKFGIGNSNNYLFFLIFVHLSLVDYNFLDKSLFCHLIYLRLV